jgi:hypothetical protein
MGSTNHGIQKTSAVEVRRGLTFYEDFESQAEVEMNGGTVTGSVLSGGKFVSDESTGRIDYAGLQRTEKLTFISTVVKQTKLGLTECILDSSIL